MDITDFRRAPIDDRRDEGWLARLQARLRSGFLAGLTDDQLKTVLQHPMTPYRELFPPAPVPPPDALSDAAGYSDIKGNAKLLPQATVQQPSQQPLQFASRSPGDSTRDAIVRAAQEAGRDPSFALAVAERESNFNPQARASRTISGIYQMRGDLRNEYGAGDSPDVYTQAKGWNGFMDDVKSDMAKRMGRQPTDPETYLGHYFGAGRAANMLTRMDPSTPVDAVFTPTELAQNPNIGRAGTVGALNQSVMGDISRRQAKFGGAGSDAPDLSSFGDLVGDMHVANASSDNQDNREYEGGPYTGRSVEGKQPPMGGASNAMDDGTMARSIMGTQGNKGFIAPGSIQKQQPAPTYDPSTPMSQAPDLSSFGTPV